MNGLIQKARDAIQHAESIFVITGAGVSAESGVPTFRDHNGLWKNVDPNKVATPEAFERDPGYVWKWYDERRTQLLGIKPNPAHYALARLEERKSPFFLLTQNVEDLHEEAGSKNIQHIHGRIWEVRCTREGTVRQERRAPLPEIPPKCSRCGALERPNVIWFGEMISETAVEATERYLMQGEIDVTLVIGTQAGFRYIMNWLMRARGNSGMLVEINLSPEGLPYTDIHLCGAAGEILPQIID